MIVCDERLYIRSPHGVRALIASAGLQGVREVVPNGTLIVL